MSIISIQPDKRSWWKRVKSSIIMQLLYGRPHFFNRFFRWLYYDVFKLGFRFENFVLPIIKNVNYNLNVKELMVVQTMTEPTGQVFYMDFKYNEKTKENNFP